MAPTLALAALAALAALSAWTVSVLGLTDAAAAPTDPPFVNVTPDPSGLLPEITDPPTPHPTIVITPPPDRTAEVVGTIVFSARGDIYRVTGKGDIKALTRGERAADAAPTWTPDGKRVVYIQTRTEQVQAFNNGHLTRFLFRYPNVMSVPAEGGSPKLIHQSIFPYRGGSWHRWVLQPAVSPDGDTIALVSDGQDGRGDVLLSLMSIKGSGLREVPGLPASSAHGHTDPDWSPDGKQIAFTNNNRSGPVGTPKIAIHTLKSGKTVLLKQGYANPSWSPDGKVIAAERTTGTGRDIVIISPRTGLEVVRLTTDGDSFAPTFSPNGDQIAFLRRKGLGVDLWIMTLDPANGYTRVSSKPVTQDGGLDAESPPAWFIPPELRKPLSTPPPDATPGPDASAEGEASGSDAP